MDKLLDITMKFLYKNTKFDDEQAEIIRYGLELIFIKVIFSAAILIAAVFAGYFWECLVFMLFFSILRSFAGGYHAQTRIACFIESVLSVGTVLFLIKLGEKFFAVSIVLTLVSLFFSVVIWKYSSVDTENKPLDDEETVIFRKKARIILTAELILSATAFLLHLNSVQNAALLSVILSGTLVFIEKCRRL